MYNKYWFIEEKEYFKKRFATVSDQILFEAQSLSGNLPSPISHEIGKLGESINLYYLMKINEEDVTMKQVQDVLQGLVPCEALEAQQILFYQKLQKLVKVIDGERERTQNPRGNNREP